MNSKFKRGGFFLALLAFILIILLGDYSNPRRDIFFRYYSKINPAFVFGYLPKDYTRSFIEDTIEETDNFRLINITFDKFPNKNHNYVILQDKTDQCSGKFLLDSDSLFWEIEGTTNLLSSQIELPTFNKYLSLKKITKKEKIITQLLYIISDFGVSDYRIINSTLKILELKKTKISANDSTALECYKILKKGFIPDFENFTYCWLENYGLFEVSFVFKKGSLVSIKDEFIFGALALSLGTDKCVGKTNNL